MVLDLMINNLILHIDDGWSGVVTHKCCVLFWWQDGLPFGNLCNVCTGKQKSIISEYRIEADRTAPCIT
jgi:hypothetical protein